MNLLARRCGCGAIFDLVHLRDRSAQCVACQRGEAARLGQFHPLSLRAISRDGNRLLRVDARDATHIWFTKALEEGLAPEWVGFTISEADEPCP